MSLFDDIDGDVKALIIGAAIVGMTIVSGLAVHEFFRHCTVTEAMRKGYESHYDDKGRLLWSKAKPETP